MRNNTEAAVEFYRRLAIGMIDFVPDLEVRAHEVFGADRMTVIVRAHAEDYGKLVGTGGKTFKAFSALLNCLGQRLQKGIELVQDRPIVGERSGEIVPFEPAQNWNPDFAIKILKDTAEDLFTNKHFIALHEAAPRTYLKLVVHPKEFEVLPYSELENALKVVFTSIGKTHGRFINVELQTANHEAQHDSRTGQGTAEASGR